MTHDDLIRRLSTITDEEAATMVSTRTRSDLADHIMSTPVERAPARRRRRVFAVGVPLAVAAAGAVAVAAITTSAKSPTAPRQPVPSSPLKAQPAALTFSTQGKYLVVKVKDPLADPARYKKEFAAHRMNINLLMVPASPSVAGTVVEADGAPGFKMIDGKGKCYSGGGGTTCPVGVKIPLGFHGSATIAFGRAARPGEQYNSTNSAFAPGEALHCVDIRGHTIDDALAILRQHKVTVPVFHYDVGHMAYNVGRDKIPGNWYVNTADPWAPGQVLLFVQSTRPDTGGGPGAYYQRLMADCRP